VRLAAFLLINLFLAAVWVLCLRRRFGLSRLEACALSGLPFAAQLIFSQLLLAAFGQLRLSALLGVLLGFAAALLAWSARGRRAAAAAPAARDPWPAVDAVNLALTLLALALAAWVALATWLLPPRGVDDLAYHLPPLYQYAQTGRIELLPLELRAQFALPLGAGLLYLWPLLFFHADTWVDGVGLALAAYGALLLFALARAFAVAARDALFIALLFLFTPVVMAQSGSNYTDLAVVACHLALLYGAVRFWQGGALIFLAMAGLAGGIGLSAKYNTLIAIATAQPIILLALWRGAGAPARWSGYALYLALTLVVPAYWWIRNALLIGEPLYPYALSLGGLRDLGVRPWELVNATTDASAGRAIVALSQEPLRMLLFLLRDPGLGSANGGLGLAFWGFGVPALGACLLRAARSARGGDLLPLLFWSIAPLILLLFLVQIDAARLPYNMRLLLVLVPMGLLALALMLEQMRGPLPGAVVMIKTVCVAGAALALAHLAGARFPTFDLSAAIADRRAGTLTTEQRYWRGAQGDMSSLASAFEPLDYLTRDGAGWDVYMAADWDVFMTAPLFGSRIQNRVWNFRPVPRPSPDALVFHTGFSGGVNRLYYVRGRITPADARRDARYELLVRAPPTELWVSRERLDEPAVRERLAEFYRRRHAGDIAAARLLAPQLPAADVVLGASSLVHGFRYLWLTGELTMPVGLVAPGHEPEEMRHRGARRAITLGAPLAGAVSRPIASASGRDGPVTVHWNELAP
jgi:hypothetical protein